MAKHGFDMPSPIQAHQSKAWKNIQPEFDRVSASETTHTLVIYLTFTHCLVSLFFKLSAMMLRKLKMPFKASHSQDFLIFFSNLIWYIYQSSQCSCCRLFVSWDFWFRHGTNSPFPSPCLHVSAPSKAEILSFDRSTSPEAQVFEKCSMLSTSCRFEISMKDFQWKDLFLDKNDTLW